MMYGLSFVCQNGLTVSLFQLIKPFLRCWYGSNFETQRELREVLNDGVKTTKDCMRKFCLQVVTRNIILSPLTLFQIDVSLIMITRTKRWRWPRKLRKLWKMIVLQYLQHVCVFQSCQLTLSLFISKQKKGSNRRSKSSYRSLPRCCSWRWCSSSNLSSSYQCSWSGRDTLLVVSVRLLMQKRNSHVGCFQITFLKGAAWNSVQIAETLHERGLVCPMNWNSELKIVISFLRVQMNSSLEIERCFRMSYQDLKECKSLQPYYPFHEDGSINFDAIPALIEHLLAHHTDGILSRRNDRWESNLTHDEELELFGCTKGCQWTRSWLRV